MKYLKVFEDKYYKIHVNDIKFIDRYCKFEKSEIDNISNICKKIKYNININSPEWIGIRDSVIQISPINNKTTDISLIQIWKEHDEWYYIEFRYIDKDLHTRAEHYKCDQFDGLIECITTEITKYYKFENYTIQFDSIVDSAEISYQELTENGFKVYVNTSVGRKVENEYEEINIVIRKENIKPFNTNDIKPYYERFLRYLKSSRVLWKKNKVGKYHGVNSIRFSYVGKKRGFYINDDFPINKEIIELHINYRIKNKLL